MYALLLHAQILQIQELLAQYRISQASKLYRGMGVVPHELHLYGDELSKEMLAEIEAAHKLGIPIVNQSPALTQCLLKVSHVAAAA